MIKPGYTMDARSSLQNGSKWCRLISQTDSNNFLRRLVLFKLQYSQENPEAWTYLLEICKMSAGYFHNENLIVDAFSCILARRSLLHLLCPVLAFLSYFVHIEPVLKIDILLNFFRYVATLS